MPDPLAGFAVRVGLCPPVGMEVSNACADRSPYGVCLPRQR
jgi:hypothetical protein